MSFHHLDRYADVASPLTRLAPVVRLLGGVMIAVGSAALPLGAWPQMAALAALVAVLAGLARIPARAFLARLAPPLAFVFLVSVALVVFVPGRPVARIGPLAVTDAGLVRFGSVLGRALPALGAAVLLVSTLRFTELVEALRTLRLPRAVTTSLGLAYRYLYTLTDEVERLRRAARSRNAGDGTATRRRLMVGITAAALTRSFDRSERVHGAMLARGYRDVVPSLRAQPVTGAGLVAMVGLALVVAVVALSAHMGPWH